jgi:hypothetical protein
VDQKTIPIRQAPDAELDTTHCKACGGTLALQRAHRMTGEDAACEVREYECPNCGMLSEVIRKDLIP